MRRQGPWSPLLLCILLPTVLLLAAQSQDKAIPPGRSAVEGSKIYQYRCAVCHGMDGRGHGPDSVVVQHRVPNLTLISQKNGGKFPYQRVRDSIEGKKTGPLSRGEREMPNWGPIFHEVELDQDWGEVRLEAITRHVESMQQK